MIYDLPTRVFINDEEYEIRSDYRAILDIFILLNDDELSESEKVEALLRIFYPDFYKIPDDSIEEAINKCFWFINGGNEEEKSSAPIRLVDWEQDFQLIAAPINRVIGEEIRAKKYLHWWTFVSAYQEIGGDCTFAQVVGIRSKLAKGKTLDKSEKEWYKKNKSLVDFKKTHRKAEDDLLEKWI